jgi:hypothetical protein
MESSPLAPPEVRIQFKKVRRNVMRIIKTLLVVGCLGFAILAVPPATKADEWNKAVRITFKVPVEIPQMVLRPGTYVFCLTNSQGDRHVVQVFNADQSHLYENVLAIPASRRETTRDLDVTFEERPNGAPQAVKTWFYPGERDGQEFVYPNGNFTTTADLPTLNSALTTSQSGN